MKGRMAPGLQAPVLVPPIDPHPHPQKNDFWLLPQGLCSPAPLPSISFLQSHPFPGNTLAPGDTPWLGPLSLDCPSLVGSVACSEFRVRPGPEHPGSTSFPPSKERSSGSADTVRVETFLPSPGSLAQQMPSHCRLRPPVSSSSSLRSCQEQTQQSRPWQHLKHSQLKPKSICSLSAGSHLCKGRWRPWNGG